MGYNLYITRAELHSENDGQWISAEEWLRYVEADPEMALVISGGYCSTRWTAHPSTPDAWLQWSGGNVHTKNVDDPLVDKMVRIAKSLGAKVQGEDGEVYTGGGRDNFIPPPPSPRSRWHRLFHRDR
jgi:hypothetical protein